MVKKILVAPLDWGLGHATRCIPVIRELQRQGAGVIIASSGDALSLLKIEFPEMMALALPAYQPVYPDKGSIVLAMMKQFSKFRKVIREENRLIEKYVADHRIDAVISDNRFGCWSLRATSVCITHQLNPIMPQGFKWLSPWVRKFLGRHFNQFEEIWIPDQPESGLTANFNPAGDSRQKFVGWLSRFRPAAPVPVEYDVLALISGPEPQRTLFENKVVHQLMESGKRALVVTGKPGTPAREKRQNLEIINHLPTNELQRAVLSSEIVLSRSGYSTIMDLIALGSKAIFVPTPQQTEQIFLAEYCKSRQIAFSINQDDFSLPIALEESLRYRGFSGFKRNSELLKQAIVTLLQ